MSESNLPSRATESTPATSQSTWSEYLAWTSSGASAAYNGAAGAAQYVRDCVPEPVASLSWTYVTTGAEELAKVTVRWLTGASSTEVKADHKGGN